MQFLATPQRLKHDSVESKLTLAGEILSQLSNSTFVVGYDGKEKLYEN